MNQNPTSMPTCSFWISVRSLVRQLVFEGSHSVSAPRAETASVRNRKHRRMDLDSSRNMPARTASPVPFKEKGELWGNLRPPPSGKGKCFPMLVRRRVHDRKRTDRRTQSLRCRAAARRAVNPAGGLGLMRIAAQPRDLPPFHRSLTQPLCDAIFQLGIPNPERGIYRDQRDDPYAELVPFVIADEQHDALA